MTFASQVRAELLRSTAKRRCCKRAEFYGMMLFCAVLREDMIKLQTENAETAKLFLELANVCCGREFSLSFTEGTGGILYSVWAEGEDAAFVFTRMGHGRGELSLGIQAENLQSECCLAPFLRGAFLAGGSVVQPEKTYRLEFSTSHARLAEELSQQLARLSLAPARARRGGQQVLYFKDSEEICDLLTAIGAPIAAMEIMNVKIEKDIRNHANRVTNCETANISKTVNAAANQVAALRKIEAAGLLDTLPRELRDAAELRRENPECSLAELLALARPKISKSGLNHRLEKLIAIAGELHP